MVLPVNDPNAFHLESRAEKHAGPFIAPRSPVERAISGIWTDVLNLKQISVDVDFYSLGGTPDQAEEIAGQLRHVFLLDLPSSALFQIPTLAGQAACIEEARLASKRKRFSIPKITRTQNMPLSFPQQRLWFFDQLAPDCALYNNGFAIDISGPFDTNLFERCLNEIIRRHESLRTKFAALDGQPFQVILPEFTLSIPILDLQYLDPAACQEEVSRLREEAAQMSFHLDQGPLLRVKILKIRPDQHIVLSNIHHIIMDGWSMGILLHELSALYAAFRAGRPSPLRELVVQYVDFASWQRQRMQGAFFDSHLAYWKTKLCDFPQPPERAAGQKLSPAQVYHGSLYSFALPAPLVVGLKDFSQRQGVTIYTTLLAAFALILHQQNGEEDFCIGTPIANRSLAELEGLIGLFINMLPLRINLSGNPVFGDFLNQVKTTTLEALAHQDMPFELLVEKLRPPRLSNHSPFFQVMLILENFKLKPLQIEDLDTYITELDTETAKLDLSMYMYEHPDQRVTCKIEYRTHLYSGETIEQMAIDYRKLLENILENPKGSVSELLQKNEPLRASIRHLEEPTSLIDAREDLHI